MNKVKLIIEIDKADYDNITNRNVDYLPSEYARQILYKAIENGTPLPKGHGRLIDADALYDQFEYADYDFEKTLEYAPTIIEAGRG